MAILNHNRLWHTEWEDSISLLVPREEKWKKFFKPLRSGYHLKIRRQDKYLSTLGITRTEPLFLQLGLNMVMRGLASWDADCINGWKKSKEPGGILWRSSDQQLQSLLAFYGGWVYLTFSGIKSPMLNTLMKYEFEYNLHTHFCIF